MLLFLFPEKGVNGVREIESGSFNRVRLISERKESVSIAGAVLTNVLRGRTFATIRRQITTFYSENMKKQNYQQIRD
jgi:hypothetical protein